MTCRSCCRVGRPWQPVVARFWNRFLPCRIAGWYLPAQPSTSSARPQRCMARLPRVIFLTEAPQSESHRRFSRERSGAERPWQCVLPAAGASHPGIAEIVEHFHDAGAPLVALSGAGPTHFTIVPVLSDAISIASKLARRAPIPMRVLIARPVPSGIQQRRRKTHEREFGYRRKTGIVPDSHATPESSKDPMTS